VVGESVANPDLFRRLCEDLGYDPDAVLSVRLTAEQAVVVVGDGPGQLHVETYATSPAGLHLVGRGPSIGPRARPVRT
jgi:hypothetical protein